MRAAIILASIAALPCLTHAQSFELFGMLPGDTVSGPGGVSGDGQVVVGGSGGKPVRWTQAQGLYHLGVPSGASGAHATLANHDGSVIAGLQYTSSGLPSPFRWTESGGMESLGHLAGSNETYVFAMSADGSVLAGGSRVFPPGPTWRPIRWTAAGGMQELATLPGRDSAHVAGMSADGSILVGTSYNHGSLDYRVVRWTTAGGPEDLGLLPGHTQAQAAGVSADGQIIVGWSLANWEDWPIVRWTSAGIERLATAPPGFILYGMGLSGDGATVFGSIIEIATIGHNTPNLRATLWTQALGLVDLNEYLPSIGIDLTGWQLTTANGASFDGTVIVGSGLYDGEHRGWIATIPSPGAALLFIFAWPAMMRRR